MGDRANIFVADDEYESGSPVGVFLYAHLGSDALPLLLKAVLKRQQRWDDPSYLARIIFCEMVRGDEAGETGYGISARLGDNEHAVTAVDCGARHVSFCHPDILVSDGIGPAARASFTFDEYVALHDDAILAAFERADAELE
jgi:hypothetical protein